jgi:intein/homing endonuclease
MEIESPRENEAKPIRQSLVLEKIKDRVNRKKNCLIAIVGGTGCLAEDTDIKIVINNEVKYCKLKELPDKFKVISYDFNKRKCEINEAIRHNSGLKDVYKITFDDGSEVIATQDHRFFKTDGTPIMVSELKKDKIEIHTGKDGYIRHSKRYPILASRDYKILNENGFYGKTHTKEFLEYKSKLHFKTGIKAYRRLAKLRINDKECYFCGDKNKRLLVHNLDEDRYNNDINNLTYACWSCHTKFHKSKDKNETTKNK